MAAPVRFSREQLLALTNEALALPRGMTPYHLDNRTKPLNDLERFIQRNRIDISNFNIIREWDYRLHIVLYLMRHTPYPDSYRDVLNKVGELELLNKLLTLALDNNSIKKPSNEPNFDKTLTRYLSFDWIVKAFQTWSLNGITSAKINEIIQRNDFIRKNNGLSNLYLFLDSDSRLPIDRAWMPIHPMEAIILENMEAVGKSVGRVRERTMINYFGMILPQFDNSMNSNSSLPVINYTYLYAKILTRGHLEVIPNDRLALLNREMRTNYLKQLKDTELFDTVGLFPVIYQNRRDLILGLDRLLSNPAVAEFLTINRKRTKYHSLNLETVSGTDINDESVYMLGFGNALHYHTYELDDLMAAFHTDSVTGVAAYRRPDNPNLVFTNDQMQDLEQFLHDFGLRRLPGARDAILLEGRIREINRLVTGEAYYFKQVQDQLTALPDDQKTLVREFWRSVFYTGMYMRRWAGPPSPFPLVQSDTECTTDPEPIVNENLQIGRDLLARMAADTLQFVKNLRAIQYSYKGEAQVQNMHFFQEWNRVLDGTQCIRMASTVFVGSGYHYLIKLFKETIPGMDRAPERIQ